MNNAEKSWLTRGMSLEDRFMHHVRIIPSSTCWEWTAWVGKTGYGQIKENGQSKLAHRVSYELFIGEIPEGLELDHICRNRRCVNPKHLEAVTGRENKLRSSLHWSNKNWLKTHCRNGHPLIEGNLVPRPLRNGQRHRTCAICEAANHQRRQKAYKSRLKQKRSLGG